MNRKSIGALSVAAAVALSLFVAGPAQAATLDIGGDCTVAGTSRYSVTAAPGETINIAHSTNCVVGTGVIPLLTTPVTKVNDYEYVVDANATPQTIANAIVILKPTGPFDFVEIDLTITGGGDSGVPADIIQQVGRPAVGCDNLRVPAADWSGVAAGGWSPSWAWWVNNGKGGPVCTRTLGYSTTTSGWFVRS